MKYSYFGIIVMILGLVAVVISVFADTFGIGGQPGFGWKQLLGVIGGGVLLIAGLTQMTKGTTADDDSAAGAQ